MSLPITSALILIFVVWLHHEMKKESRLSKKTLDLFWQKERESNQARKKDISGLDYLTVSLDSLPMEDIEDDTANSYRDLIRKLSDRRMINLCGLTNTELKFRYGAANLALLTEYDNNYTSFVSMLHKWAVRLADKGFISRAQTVLEFSIYSCRTDVMGSYRMLARLYHEQNRPDRIDSIAEMISRTKIKQKEALILELNTIKNKPF